MTAGAPPPLGELLAVLDEQADLLARQRGQLEGLSAALLARDDDQTERLLEAIQQAGADRAHLDRRLAAVRAELAERLGRPPDRLRLSALIDALPAGAAAAVRDRRRRLIDLAEQFRAEHLRTALLLGECARINGQMLQCLLGGGQALVTYDADGADRWASRSPLMDMER
jgi:flagellar biosynthesis/type III secretory pathway chaperone